jgi:hypothetical protein
MATHLPQLTPQETQALEKILEAVSTIPHPAGFTFSFDRHPQVNTPTVTLEGKVSYVDVGEDDDERSVPILSITQTEVRKSIFDSLSGTEKPGSPGVKKPALREMF